MSNISHLFKEREVLQPTPRKKICILNVEVLRYIYPFFCNPHKNCHRRAFSRPFPYVPACTFALPFV